MTDNPSFEDALAALEECVARLESGDLSLEETLTVFERGQNLLAVCEEALEKAELTLETLQENGQERTGFASVEGEG